ncbi:uncharacterized protein LOC127736565 [Mytilus californianus]|uniref:uncharacterized protein LOC127736565 n=1 Tax=Mytilus californianus TaxID=6549 RepID=UPI002247C616|nr:uncharacterized protein LOC127736565 [Mytilus californianus]
MSKEEKTGKHRCDIEMGNVYGNAQMIIQDNSEDSVYANAESKLDNRTNTGKVYIPKKNKDGLIYADLELDPSPSGKKFVIRGLENKTNYAIIDLNVKVDPLPSDDDDDEVKENKTDEDTNQKDSVE